MKVNIVCDEPSDGWVYSRFIEYFKRYSKHKIVVNGQGDICHFLPYYTYKSTQCPSTCWLSHQEKSNPLYNQFIKVAQSVDVGISHSKKYATMLRNDYNCINIISIITGVDSNVFTMRPATRKDNKKLVVVYSGRPYTSSKRKNPKLIERIRKLPFADFRSTDGKLSFKQLNSFYHQGDVCIQPSTIEGGSMSIQESLACGIPVVSMKGVGVTNEFDFGVIKAQNDNDFVSLLKDMYDSGAHLGKWKSKENMQKMRNQIINQTWENFVKEHDLIWDMISTKSWKKS